MWDGVYLLSGQLKPHKPSSSCLKECDAVILCICSWRVCAWCRVCNGDQMGRSCWSDTGVVGEDLGLWDWQRWGSKHDALLFVYLLFSPHRLFTLHFKHVRKYTVCCITLFVQIHNLCCTCCEPERVGFDECNGVFASISVQHYPVWSDHIIAGLCINVVILYFVGFFPDWM